MRYRWMAAALAACSTFNVGADEKFDIPAEFKRISEKLIAAVRPAPGSAAPKQSRAEALKEYRESVKNLLARAGKADPKSYKAPEAVALAQAANQLGRPEEADGYAVAALASEPKNVTANEIHIRSLATASKLQAAEAALKQAAFLPVASSAELHYTLYSAQRRAKNWEAAVSHLKAYLNWRRDNSAGAPPTLLVRTATQLADAYQNLGKTDAALAAFDQETAALAGKAAKNGEAWTIVTELRMEKAKFLNGLKRDGEARKIVADEGAALAKAATEKSANLKSVIARTSSVAQTSVELTSNETVAAKEQSDFFAFLAQQAKANRTNPEVLGACFDAYSSWINDLTYSDPKVAKTVIASARSLAKGLAGASEKVRGRVEQAEKSLTAAEVRLKPALERADLIGKRSFPLEADAWVNGAPLSADALRGKVVVLDFWAVWCGPCIATFPHLIEWTDKYEKAGLTIVGSTNYYEYGWDPVAKQAKLTGATPEAERQACDQFAKNHGLKHRIIYAPKGATMAEKYHVQGIPQVVVIDRNGVIRMIRVGSGEKNARDLEAMIVKLLADPVSSSAVN